jgi:hypothetical protein
MADAESPVDREVMEKVLQETLSAAGSDEPVGSAEMQALVEVARRHAGQSISLDPIAIELVESILLCRFGPQLRRSQDAKELPRTVAETLWENPDSHDRLLRLWNRLAEAR